VQTEAAVLWDREAWSVEPIELDPPKGGRGSSSRLAGPRACAHSDEQPTEPANMPVPLPIIGGHEGCRHCRKRWVPV